MFLSSLETFNYLMLWTSSGVPPVLTLSSKLTRPKRQRVSFHTNGSIVQRKWTTKSFLLVTPFLAFCAIATPLKKIATTIKTLSTVVQHQCRLWSSYELIEYLQLVLKIIRICKACGRIITCNISRNSSSGITIKMLFRLWRQCRKWLNFPTTRGLIC